MKNATGPLIQLMIDQLTPYIAPTGKKAPEAAKELAKAFGEPLRNGEEFLGTMKASREAVTRFQEAAARGDQVETLIEMFQVLREATQKVDEAMHASTSDAAGAAKAYATMGSSAYDAAASATILARELSKINSGQARKVAEDMAAMVKAAGDQAKKNPTGKPIEQVSVDIEKEKLRMEAAGKTNAEILAMEADTWRKRIALGKLSLKAKEHAEISAGRAQLDSNKATGESLIEEARNTIAQINANTLRGDAEREAATVGVWRKLLGDQRLNAEQRKGVERDYSLAVAQLRGEEAAKTLRAAQEATNAAKTGTAERVALAQHEVTIAVAKWGEYSEQAKSAHQRVTEAVNAEAARQREIAIKSVDDYIKQQDRRLAATIKHIEQAAKQRQISAAQQEALESGITTVVLNNELKRLTATLATLEKGTTQYQATADKITAIQDNLSDKLAAIQDKLQADLFKGWTGYFREIESGFDQLFSSVLNGQEKFGAAFEKLIGQLVSKVLGDLVKIAIQEAAFQGALAIGAPKTAQAIGNPLSPGAGGIGSLIGSAFGVGGGAAGNVAQAANTSALAALTAATGVATTATTTASTVTGANSLAVTTNTASGVVVNTAATGVNSVAIAANTSALAASAAGGAASSAAGGAGFVGKILSIFGFAEGAQMITQSGIAVIHAGETVVPAQSSGPYRAPQMGTLSAAAMRSPGSGLSLPSFAMPSFGEGPLPSGGAGLGGGGGAGETHFHFSPQVNAMDGQDAWRVIGNPSLQRKWANSMKALLRDNMSLRPTR